MDEGLAYLYLFVTTIIACTIAVAAKKCGPEGQRRLALLCVVLGFVSLAIEVMSWAGALRTSRSGTVYIVYGGEVAFWIAAGYLYKMSRSAKSVSVTLVAKGRTDREAAKVYAKCLREVADPEEDLLRLACKAFAEHGHRDDLIEAAGRLLQKKPKDEGVMASLVGAYLEKGSLRDAERVAARFAEASPGSEQAALVVEKVRALRADAAAKAPTRTLVDLAQGTSPSDWTPIKIKRYVTQIVKVLEQFASSNTPRVVGPEDIVANDANELTYQAAPAAKMHTEFTPPEGPLQAGDGLGPGLVYAAGQLVYFLLTGGRGARGSDESV